MNDNNEPLIWTEKTGIIPVSSLRYETGWQDTPEYVAFRERYFLGEELVRENVHVHLRQGQAAQAEQAQL